MQRRGGLPPRLTGTIIASAGVALALTSLLADVLGVGTPGTTFGYRQFLGTLAGLALIVVGMAIVLHENGPPRGEL
jgi:hypothetical protein